MLLYFILFCIGGHSGDGCMSTSFLNVGWNMFCSELGEVMMGCSGECCFRVYVEWYGVCNVTVFSVVGVCVLTMVVCMYFMFVFVLAFVSKSGVWCVLLNVVCFLSMGVACCVVMWYQALWSCYFCFVVLLLGLVLW